MSEPQATPGQAPVLPTIEDLRGCGWKAVIAGKEGPTEIWPAFSAAAREALAADSIGKSNALTLLADVSSLRLVAASASEPFKPMMVMGNKRTSVTDDFTPEQAALLAEFLAEVDHPFLRARLADLAWILTEPRDPNLAEAAIDAYSTFPLTVEGWVRGSQEAWRRALRLARSTKAKAKTSVLERALIGAFDAATDKEGFLALWLTGLLEEHGLAHDRRGDVATKLAALSSTFEAAGDLHRAHEYAEGAATWYRRDLQKFAEMVSRIADLWMKRADGDASRSQPAGLAAHTFLENAIHALRRIPKAQRAALTVDERITALHRRLADAGKITIQQMAEIRSPTIDISDEIARAEEAVQGKSAIEALFAFANLYGGAKVDRLRASAEKMLREHPLRSLFGASHMSSDGRVIAKRPGFDFSDPDSAEAAIRAEMVEEYTRYTGLVMQAQVWPALQIIIHEHRLRETDFLQIASGSPVVPPARAGLVAKALYAGFELDFTAAVHVMVPQLENLVRYHLKRAGAKTSTINSDGIETENGLSTLIELEHAQKIFGPDLCFEIKASFCDPMGPNLRNEVAHGLLDDGACQSGAAIFGWWRFFRLIFNPYWQANIVSQTQSPIKAGDIIQ